MAARTFSSAADDDDSDSDSDDNDWETFSPVPRAREQHEPHAPQPPAPKPPPAMPFEEQTRAEVDAMSPDDVATCCAQLAAEDGMPPLPPRADDAARRRALLQHFCPGAAALQQQPQPQPAQQPPPPLSSSPQQQQPPPPPPTHEVLSQHPDAIFVRYDRDGDGVLRGDELHRLVLSELCSGHADEAIEGALGVILLDCGFVDAVGECKVPMRSFPALWELMCTRLVGSAPAFTGAPPPPQAGVRSTGGLPMGTKESAWIERTSSLLANSPRDYFPASPANGGPSMHEPQPHELEELAGLGITLPGLPDVQVELSPGLQLSEEQQLERTQDLALLIAAQLGEVPMGTEYMPSPAVARRSNNLFAAAHAATSTPSAVSPRGVGSAKVEQPAEPADALAEGSYERDAAVGGGAEHVQQPPTPSNDRDARRQALLRMLKGRFGSPPTEPEPEPEQVLGQALGLAPEPPAAFGTLFPPQYAAADTTATPVKVPAATGEEEDRSAAATALLAAEQYLARLASGSPTLEQATGQAKTSPAHAKLAVSDPSLTASPELSEEAEMAMLERLLEEKARTKANAEIQRKRLQQITQMAPPPSKLSAPSAARVLPTKSSQRIWLLQQRMARAEQPPPATAQPVAAVEESPPQPVIVPQPLPAPKLPPPVAQQVVPQVVKTYSKEDEELAAFNRAMDRSDRSRNIDVADISAVIEPGAEEDLGGGAEAERQDPAASFEDPKHGFDSEEDNDSDSDEAWAAATAAVANPKGATPTHVRHAATKIQTDMAATKPPLEEPEEPEEPEEISVSGLGALIPVRKPAAVQQPEESVATVSVVDREREKHKQRLTRHMQGLYRMSDDRGTTESSSEAATSSDDEQFAEATETRRAPRQAASHSSQSEAGSDEFESAGELENEPPAEPARPKARPTAPAPAPKPEAPASAPVVVAQVQLESAIATNRSELISRLRAELAALLQIPDHIILQTEPVAQQPVVQQSVIPAQPRPTDPAPVVAPPQHVKPPPQRAERPPRRVDRLPTAKPSAVPKRVAGRKSPSSRASPAKRRSPAAAARMRPDPGGGGRNFWDASSSESDDDDVDESGEGGFDSSDDDEGWAAAEISATGAESPKGAPPTPPARVSASRSRKVSPSKPKEAAPAEAGVVGWHTQDVASWLADLGLAEHAGVFQQQKITGRALLHLAQELNSADWTQAAAMCAGLGLVRVGEVALFRGQLRELLRK